MTTLLAFLLTLGVLITFHEYGHYRVAKACGVKVERFAIGFGPVLWRRQAHPDSTEFVLCALPLGGYVRMFGHGSDPVLPEDEHHSFRHKPLWQRAAIVAAGPVANLALAVLLYIVSFSVGVDEPQAKLGSPAPHSVAAVAGLRAGDWVKAVSDDGQDWSEVRSMSDLQWRVTQNVLDMKPLHLRVVDGSGHVPREVVLDLASLQARDLDAAVWRRVGLFLSLGPARIGAIKDGPAKEAGLLQGDVVTQMDGMPVNDLNQMLARIRANTDGRTMDWQVQRQGETVSLTVVPQVDDVGGERIGRIHAEVAATPAPAERVSYGLFEAVPKAMARTWDTSVLTLKMIWRVVTFQASPKNISGPLTMADYAGQSIRLGLSFFLGFLAVVSISLGVLNLLPVPVLDGGHLMYYLFEAVTGRPPSDVWIDRLTRGGLAILVMMMSLAFYNDLVRQLGPH